MAHVDVLSDGVGWALMNSPLGGPIRVYRTRDGGRSWTPVDGLWVKVPLQPPPSIGITAFFAPVVTDPQGGAATSASVGEGSQGVAAPESLYVYGKPARGGWLGPLKVWSGKTVVTGIPVLQAAGGRWWLSVGATVSSSHDGGLHFATHALPMPADAIGIAYDFVDALNAYILVRPRDCSAGCTTTLLATTDAGNSWDTRTAPG